MRRMALVEPAQDDESGARSVIMILTEDVTTDASSKEVRLRQGTGIAGRFGRANAGGCCYNQRLLIH